jgi:hypothetical protein
MMDQDRFEALADAYGGDMARWPDAEREAAKAYVEAHPDRADAILKAATALDAILQSAAEAAPSQALFDRVVADGEALRRPAAPAWAAMAAAVMMTVGLGTGWLAAPETAVRDDEVFGLAFGALEEIDVFGLEEDA